ncbi:MAG: RidA family protein [Candidatus Acidiferrales bacterium]
MAARKQRKRKATRRPAKRGARGRSNHRIERFAAEATKPLPFSEAVRADGMLYLAGQLGTDENLNLAPGGIQAETKRALENIRAVLERHGSSLDRVVKCTVMMADMSEWRAMNEIYVTFFAKNSLPARSAFGSTGLAFGARVEIECIAALK